MRLTLNHGNDPAEAQVVNAETGEVLEGVTKYTLDRPGYAPVEHLTVTVVLRPVDGSHGLHDDGKTATPDSYPYGGVATAVSTPLRGFSAMASPWGMKDRIPSGS